MDYGKIIRELTAERDNIEECLRSMQRLAHGQGKRRGRPPAWMQAAKKRGRPFGSTNAKKAATA